MRLLVVRMVLSTDSSSPDNIPPPMSHGPVPECRYYHEQCKVS
jgi:hypothetical protein